MTKASRGHCVRFGDCELDLQSGELWRNGQRTTLPEQPFRILQILITQPGVLVTREALQRELWPDGTFVDYEHSINAAVKRLREILDDSATSPRFVETVPRRGYRFIAAVENDAPAATPVPVDPPARPRPRRIAMLAAGIAAVGLLGLGSVWLRRHTPVVESTYPTPIRITSTPGVNADPALSPDGTLVAFASDRRNASNSDIWVQRIGSSTAIPLTEDDADESEPSFSSDGSEIVYSQRDVGLFVIPALGGERRLVARSPWARTPRFSPDVPGQQTERAIAYWTGFPASVVAGGIPGALGSIFIVPARGGTPVQLQTSLASVRYPVWSPDGSKILMLGEEDSDQKVFDWYVVSRDGGTAIKTGAIAAMRAAGLQTNFPIPSAWTAADNAVLFSSNEVDTSSLWTISISPITGRVLGGARSLTRGTAIERQPTIANNGRVAFASVIESVNIWRLPVDPRTGVATGEPERLTNDAASDRLRSVTADGRIVYISSRTGRDEVWVKNLKTGHEQQVTHEGVDDASGSADGRKIAYSPSSGPRSRILLVDIDAEHAVPEVLCSDCYGPSNWATDNSRMIISLGRAPTRLDLMDLASRHATDLVSHPAWSAGMPKISRDNKWVVFHSANSPNVRQVYAVSLSSSLPAKDLVPIVLDHGCHPSWSERGDLVTHFSFRDGAFCPWVQRVDPNSKRPIGPPYVVRHFHEPRLRAASGSAAFNDQQGGYLYLSLTETTSQVWVMDAGEPRVAHQ